MLPWVDLQFVIVVIPDHDHLLFKAKLAFIKSSITLYTPEDIQNNLICIITSTITLAFHYNETSKDKLSII